MAKLLPDSIQVHPEDSTFERQELEQVWKNFTSEHEYVSFGVADGQAVYAIVSWRPFVLQHVDWLDGYQAHPALIRGLRAKDAKEQIAMRERFERMV